MIVFDNPLHSLTKGYIEVLRKTPNVNERNEALVFVTYGGTNMGLNLVRLQLWNFLESVVGVKEEEQIQVLYEISKLRKFIVMNRS